MCGIEKTKALVEAGADVNHKTSSGETASVYALWHAGEPEYAHFLIVQQRAQVSEPYSPFDSSREIHRVSELRDWIFDRGSKKHQLKMEIVDEFARQGVDYWSTEINEHTLRRIQSRYPDDWEEYIKKY